MLRKRENTTADLVLTPFTRWPNQTQPDCAGQRHQDEGNRSPSEVHNHFLVLASPSHEILRSPCASLRRSPRRPLDSRRKKMSPTIACETDSREPGNIGSTRHVKGCALGCWLFGFSLLHGLLACVVLRCRGQEVSNIQVE